MSNALFTIFVDSVLDTSKFDKGMEGSATKVESSLSRMASAAKQYLGAGGLLWSFNRANAQAMQFGQTMADVAAITELNVDKMAKSLLKLDHIFGRPAQTGYTLYETISSGIKGTEEDLLHFVEVAGKTAKVIRADTYTTSNALTTMMHAYGISARESTKLMDIMYTTVKEGKAHGDELARTLGLVVNNASESGIAIKDLFAAIATLSRTMTTSNAMISLNQMMNSFLGPTEEARRVAREYGIEMDVAAIKSKGFAAVMKDIHDKVGGNVEAIKSLFGNIRAARGALVLTGSQFDNFIDVLHEFDRTAGEAEVAFKTQTETTQASAERMRAAFNKLQITVGSDLEGLTKTFYKLGTVAMDGFSNAEGALGGFVNSVGGNFKSDSPLIQFLNSADKLTASWSRFFIYFTIGAKIFSRFAKAAASVEMAMKGMAQAGKINAAGAASAQGLGSDIPGAVSEKMPSPAKIQKVSVTEPVNQINLQLKELGVSLKQLATNINKIKDKAASINTTAIDIHHYIQSARGEFDLLLKNWKKIQKKMIALSKKGETASVTIQECSASVQAFLASARKLSKLLLAISTKAEEIRLSLNPANASMTKAVGAIGRVSVGASTMSGSLSVIAKSIEQTNGHFLRAISYAGSVNMGVQALEARLLTLSRALAGKASPAILKTSPASKAPTGKSSSITKTSNDAPKVPAVQQQAKSFVSTSGEKAWLALLYKGETDIAPGRIKPYPKKNIKVRNMGYEGDWMFASPAPRPRYIDRALTDGPTGLGPGTMFTRKGQSTNSISEKRIPDNDWFIRRDNDWFMRNPAKIAEEYNRPSADVIRAAMRNRRDALSAVGLSERTTFHALNRGLLLPQNAGQNGNPVLPSVSKADFAKLQKLQQQGSQYYGNLGGVFPLVPTEFPPPYNDQFSNTPGNFSSRMSGADYRNIQQMVSRAMGRGLAGLLNPALYDNTGWQKMRTPFQRRIASVVPKEDYADTGLNGGKGFIKKLSDKADKVVNMGKTAFTKIGNAFLRVAKVGMGVFGAISAIQIGWSIGTQIAEKFKFSESRLYQAIADAVVGKSPGSTRKEEEEIGVYNVTRMGASATQRIKALWEAKKIDANRYNRLMNAVYAAYATGGGEGVRKLRVLNDTLEEITEATKTATDSYSDAIKSLNKAVEAAKKAYEEQAERIRKKRESADSAEYTDEELGAIRTSLVDAGIRAVKGLTRPVRDLGIYSRMSDGSISPEDAAIAYHQRIVDADYPPRRVDADYTHDVAEILSKLSTDRKRRTEEELRKEFTRDDNFIISEEDFKKIVGILSTRIGVSDVDLAVLSGLESDVRMREANVLTGTAIEEAKKKEAQARDTMLAARSDEVLKAITEGMDSSVVEERRASLKAAETDVLKSIFDGIQAKITELGDSPEFSKLTPEEKDKAMRSLRVAGADYFKRYLTNLEATKAAQSEVFQKKIQDLQTRQAIIGYQKELGTIGASDYSRRMIIFYEAQIAALKKMRDSFKTTDNQHREYQKQILEVNIALKEHRKAVLDSGRALREGAFDSVRDMAQGGNRSTLYHAANILGIAGGPALLARLTAPTMSMQDPFTLGKAQKAQQSLAATMDSYLMSQKYEQANVGKTVTKIYDFISKNNAIVLR